MEAVSNWVAGEQIDIGPAGVALTVGLGSIVNVQSTHPVLEPLLFLAFTLHAYCPAVKTPTL